MKLLFIHSLVVAMQTMALSIRPFQSEAVGFLWHRCHFLHHIRSASTSSALKSQKDPTLQPLQNENIQSKRKAPIFPGAMHIDASVDLETCANQTGQSAPSNALLGKPFQCQCRHGYAQAFSLDPMPPTQRFKKKSMDRLNSGLMKLTCPLLVSSIDLLEDDGFMKEINTKLVEEESGRNEWQICMNDAHAVHAKTRQDLIFGEKSSGKDQLQILQSKLGERGAQAFLDAGVAGANPSAKSLDVKCLHAWMADYLFRKKNDNSNERSGDLVTEHPIGDAIVKALKSRGVDISGTDTCHEICSGCSQSSIGSVDNSSDSISVHVPIPRNKQRRKRRGLKRVVEKK